MKVQIKSRPTGAYNGQPWPEVGEVIDLPEFIAVGMLRTGSVTSVPVETPAPVEVATADTSSVETAVKPRGRPRKAR